MAIILLPPTPEDARAMIDTGMAAFANDNLNKAQFGLATAPPEQSQDFRRWRIKAVDDSNGFLVGYIGVFAPGVLPPEPNLESRPPQVNEKIGEEVSTKMKAIKKRYVGERDDVWCKSRI